MSEVVAFKQPGSGSGSGELKDLYEVGEIPPLGHVPAKMYAWVIRKDRHGPPDQGMQLEVVPTCSSTATMCLSSPWPAA